VSDIDTLGIPTVGIDEDEVNRRKLLQARYRAVFNGDVGTAVLADLGDILHYFGPAYTPEDMALQNAFKTVLHRLGAWADDDQGRLDIIRKLRS
jgi:hypothetical protein